MWHRDQKFAISESIVQFDCKLQISVRSLHNLTFTELTSSICECKIVATEFMIESTHGLVMVVLMYSEPMELLLRSWRCSVLVSLFPSILGRLAPRELWWIWRRPATCGCCSTLSVLLSAIRSDFSLFIDFSLYEYIKMLGSTSLPALL